MTIDPDTLNAQHHARQAQRRLFLKGTRVRVTARLAHRPHPDRYVFESPQQRIAVDFVGRYAMPALGPTAYYADGEEIEVLHHLVEDETGRLRRVLAGDMACVDVILCQPAVDHVRIHPIRKDTAMYRLITNPTADEYTVDWLLAETQPCAACGSPAVATYHAGHPVCADCLGAAGEYQDRVAWRIERLEERAAATRQQESALWNKARDMARIIPFGQPILVGHHSEQRDRNYRKRIENTHRKAYATHQEADRLEYRAEAAASNTAISSDDPLAVVKLLEKIEAAEQEQARMRAANKIIHKHGENDLPAIMELQELGFTRKQARELWKPDFARRRGFPPYALRNNNANIRRMQQRVADLRAQAAARGPDEEEEVLPGVTVVRSTEDNRLRLVFDGKPPAAIRDILKANGWRWSRANMAWQRHLNANSEATLSRTLDAIRKYQERQES